MSRDPREEAERLVAAALAALSTAARGTAGIATGSAECCVCPVCRAIAAAREPDPAFAERLATGMGDLASGLAGFLRAFGSPGTPTEAGTGGDHPDPDVWRAATAGTTASDAHAAPAPPKPMAKKAVKRAKPQPDT